jgi:hypothetical protein
MGCIMLLSSCGFGSGCVRPLNVCSSGTKSVLLEEISSFFYQCMI